MDSMSLFETRDFSGFQKIGELEQVVTKKLKLTITSPKHNFKTFLEAKKHLL